MKRILLKSVFIFALPLFINAQIQLAPERQLNIIDKPILLENNDMDNDGDQDVLILSENGNFVWLENTNGSGSFSKQHTILYLGGAVYCANYVDLNGDEHKDLLYNQSGSIKVRLFLPEKNKYSGYRLIISGSSSQMMAVDDIDNDGDNDIIIPRNAGNIYVFKNKQNSGNFELTQTISASPKIMWVAVGDIDFDGHADIAGASSAGCVLRYSNAAGSGTFSTADTLLKDMASVDHIYIDDITASGTNDIIYEVDGAVSYMTRTANSSEFENPVLIRDFGYYIRDLEIADIDNNGLLDIIGIGSSYISYRLNYGGGTFDIFDNPLSIYDDDRALKLNICDVDNDYDLDVMYSSMLGRRFGWCRNNGRYSWAKDLNPLYQSTTQKVAIADMDGDNIDELIYSHIGYNSSKDFYWTSCGKKCEFHMNTAPLADVDDIDPIDFDADGDMDLFILCNQSSGADSLYLYTNTDGKGSLSEPEFILTLSQLEQVEFFDIDSDNDIDLFVSTNSGIVFYENVAGEFTNSKSIFSPGREPTITGFVDVDKDGYTDIIGYTLWSFSNGTYWIKNIDNTLDFTATSIGDYSYNTFVTDIDNDNDNDIVAVQNSKLKLFRNVDTVFSFSHNVDPAGSPNISNADMADLNNDNHMDFIVYSSDDEDVFLYINNGSGSFSRQLIKEYLNSGRSILAHDFDNDGDNDLIYEDGYWDEIMIRENLAGFEISEEPADIEVCASGEGTLEFSAVDVTSYQWQFDPGTGFEDLNNSDSINGVHSNTLEIYQVTDYLSSVPFRCKVYSGGSSVGDTTIAVYANHLVDTESPEFTLNDISILLNSDGSASIQITDIITDVTDNCFLADTTIDVVDFDCANLGENTIEVSVTDASGNKTTKSAKVSVSETIKPTIEVPDDAQIEIDFSESYIVNGTEFDPISTSDNCSVSSITNDFNDTESLAGSSLPEGNTTIKWTISDASGNTTEASLLVTVDRIIGVVDIEQFGVKIYPNPAEDFLYIESTDERIKELSIFDLSGKKLINITDLKNDTEVNLTKLSKGMYIIKIQTADTSVAHKFLKK